MNMYLGNSYNFAKSGVTKTQEMYARLTAHETHWYAVIGKLFCVYYLYYYAPFIVEHSDILLVLLTVLVAPKVFEGLARGKQAVMRGAVGAAEGILNRAGDSVVQKAEDAIDKVTQGSDIK